MYGNICRELSVRLGYNLVLPEMKGPLMRPKTGPFCGFPVPV